MNAPPRLPMMGLFAPRRRARSLRLAATAATLLVALGWVLPARPTALGGPASYILVSGTSMEPTLHDGDLVLARRQATYRRGDVIAYRVPADEVGAGALVIHRLVGGSARDGYRTQGDNRGKPDLWRPRPSDVQGRQIARIPSAGRVLALMRAPLPFALIAGLIAFVSVGRSRSSHGER